MLSFVELKRGWKKYHHEADVTLPACSIHLPDKSPNLLPNRTTLVERIISTGITRWIQDRDRFWTFLLRILLLAENTTECLGEYTALYSRILLLHCASGVLQKPVINNLKVLSPLLLSQTSFTRWSTWGEAKDQLLLPSQAPPPPIRWQ